jgi:TRAP-type C4-dicarboxylate transport system permease small subunit
MHLASCNRALLRVEKVFCYVAAGLVFIMIFPTTIDVIFRYIMEEPLPAIFQLTEFMMVGVVYLGISYVQSLKEHIKIEMATSWLPPRGRDFLDVFAYLVGLLLFAIITWQSGRLAWEAWVTQDYTMGIIHFPFWPAKSIIPIGCGLLCIRLLLDIFLGIQGLRRGGPVSRAMSLTEVDK